MITIGLDFGSEAYRYCIYSPAESKKLESGVLPNAPWAFEGWFAHVEARFGNEVRAGLELNGGLTNPLVEAMKRRGWTVVGVLPNAVKSYRENVLRIHDKTDDTDAYSIAKLTAESANPARVARGLSTLQQLTRTYEMVTKDHTRYLNRLRKTLGSYWPEAARSPAIDLQQGKVLQFLEAHPDPVEVASLGEQGVFDFFRQLAGRGRPIAPNKIAMIVELARKNAQCAVNKETLLTVVQHYVRLLRAIDSTRQALAADINQRTTKDRYVRALAARKGVGVVPAATVVAEIQDIACFRTEPCLASFSGVGVRRVQTGKTFDFKKPQRRCNRHLKRSLVGIARMLCLHDPASAQYYKRKAAEVPEADADRHAIRALARQVCRWVYRTLRKEHAQTQAEANVVSASEPVSHGQSGPDPVDSSVLNENLPDLESLARELTATEADSGSLLSFHSELVNGTPPAAVRTKPRRARAKGPRAATATHRRT